MSRGLSATILAEILKPSIEPIILARIETNPDLVLAWNGVGDLVFDGETYKGLGTFARVTAVEETTAFKATGLKFMLSGVASTIVSVALQQVEQGRSARLFIGFYNSLTRTLVDAPIEIWDGLTDVPRIQKGRDTATVVVSAESHLVAFRQASNRRFTDQDQRRDYPTDEGFAFVAGLVDKTITFGRA